MLFFIGSVLLHIYNCSLKSMSKTVSTDTQNDNMAFLKLILKGCRQSCSIVLRRASPTDKGSTSNLWRHGSVSASMERVMTAVEGKQVVFTDPKIRIHLREWTSYIDQQKYPVLHQAESQGKLFVLITASSPESTEDVEKCDDKDMVKLSDCITPLAWKSGDYFGIIGECSEESLKHLTLAFVRNSLEIEDNLQPVELCTVDLEGHAQTLLKTDSTASFSPIHSFTDLSLLHKSLMDDPTLIPNTEENGASANALPSSTYMSGRANSSSENSECDDNHLLNHMEEEYSAGESLFSATSMGESETQIEFGASTKDGLNFNLASCSNSASPESSPSKGPFSEEGGGEALSPTMEYDGLLTPFRGGNNIMSKPPNVLIYCGKKDSQRHFDVFKNVFSLCLNSDKYILYHLKHEHVFTIPWIDNATCLIICCDRLYDHIEMKFLDYFKQGGNVLAFSSTFDSLFVEKQKQEGFSGVLNLKYGRTAASSVTTICGRSSYVTDLGCKLDGVEIRTVGVDTDNRSVIMEAMHESSGGMAVLSQSNLDKDPSDMAISPEIYSILKQANPQRFVVLRAILSSLGLDCKPGSPPQITACHLIAVNQNSKNAFMNSLKKRLKDCCLHSSKMNLHFIKFSDHVTDTVHPDTIPVLLESPGTSLKFNIDEYIRNLQTKELGQTVLHGDVVTSTMPFVDSLMMSTPRDAGLIVIANRQTGGKGRGGNVWISPEGCAMFSLHIKLSLSSALGQKLSFIQHITTLAVVEAVTSMEGYQNFPLRIKWPNDVYYEKNIKVGGAIVTSSIMADAVDINIGCGVNVNNYNPTACVNELIQQYNKTQDANLHLLTPEQLIARTVTCIEQFVEVFQSKREDEFLEKYYSRWMHDSQRVAIQGEDAEVTVIGLDDYGFLKVCRDDGALISLHPDGNSFDMMQNLIHPKTA